MKSTIMNALIDCARTSTQNIKHAALATKNGKIVVVRPNSTRSSFTIGDQRHINCSLHAEMSVLAALLRPLFLRRRHKKQCFL